MLSLVPLHDFADLAEALSNAHLPATDIAESGRRFWRATDEDGTTIGYGGFEGAGADLLLRSVVVLPSKRGAGLGRVLIGSLLREAARLGVQRVWLLTTDAADFFLPLGFRDVERSAAPAVVTGSLQFTGLCPAGARVLMKAAPL